MNDPRTGLPQGTPQNPQIQPQQRPMITPRPAMAPQPPAGTHPPIAPRPAITPQAPGLRPPGAPIAPRPQPQPQGQPVKEETPIALDELAGEENAPAPASKIKFGPDIIHRSHEWKRNPNVTHTGSIRVRTFHGKLSEQGLEYLDDTVNTWLDAHPEVEVKFVTSAVGLFEGKMKDLALILSLWY